MQALDIAAQQLGMNETDQRVALTEYLENGGVNLDPAVTAWCAAFVNATLQQAGQEGTGSNMARSFMDWGTAVDQPQVGDLAVFSRGDPNGPFGHVGFFQGYDENGNILVLGGNQGDAVSVAPYSPDRLLGFRRGEQAPQQLEQPAQGNQLAQMSREQQANALSQMLNQPTQLNPQAFQMRGNALQQFGFAPGQSPYL